MLIVNQEGFSSSFSHVGFLVPKYKIRVIDILEMIGTFRNLERSIGTDRIRLHVKTTRVCFVQLTINKRVMFGQSEERIQLLKPSIRYVWAE